MDTKIDISIVVPVYNNSSTISELTQRITSHLGKYNFEIIYVDDASQDQVRQMIESMVKKKVLGVRLLPLPYNQGQQKATMEGLKLARGRRIVVLDADLQDQPERILDLHEILENYSGACFIKRAGEYQKKGRMLTSRILKLVVQWISKLNYKAGSFYMIDQHTLKRILAASSDIKRPYLSIMAASFADNISYVEAKRAKTNEPSSYTFRKRVKAAYRAIGCAVECKKLKKRY